MRPRLDRCGEGRGSESLEGRPLSTATPVKQTHVQNLKLFEKRLWEENHCPMRSRRCAARCANAAPQPLRRLRPAGASANPSPKRRRRPGWPTMPGKYSTARPGCSSPGRCSRSSISRCWPPMRPPTPTCKGPMPTSSAARATSSRRRTAPVRPPSRCIRRPNSSRIRSTW